MSRGRIGEWRGINHFLFAGGAGDSSVFIGLEYETNYLVKYEF